MSLNQDVWYSGGNMLQSDLVCRVVFRTVSIHSSIISDRTRAAVTLCWRKMKNLEGRWGGTDLVRDS